MCAPPARQFPSDLRPGVGLSTEAADAFDKSSDTRNANYALDCSPGRRYFDIIAGAKTLPAFNERSDA